MLGVVLELVRGLPANLPRLNVISGFSTKRGSGKSLPATIADSLVLRKQGCSPLRHCHGELRSSAYKASFQEIHRGKEAGAVELLPA